MGIIQKSFIPGWILLPFGIWNYEANDEVNMIKDHIGYAMTLEKDLE